MLVAKPEMSVYTITVASLDFRVVSTDWLCRRQMKTMTVMVKSIAALVASEALMAQEMDDIWINVGSVNNSYAKRIPIANPTRMMAPAKYPRTLWREPLSFHTRIAYKLCTVSTIIELITACSLELQTRFMNFVKLPNCPIV